MRDDTADNLRRQSEAARNLIASLNDDDEELRHDMTEGETDFFEAIDAALAEIDECEIQVEGCKAKEAQIADRRKRAERRIEKIRTLIEQAMLIADLPTAKLATATLSVSHLPPKPVIEDEAAIPAEFWKAQDPKLDRTAINQAVKDGRAIPGVCMSNGTTSLKIRRA